MSKVRCASKEASLHKEAGIVLASGGWRKAQSTQTAVSLSHLNMFNASVGPFNTWALSLHLRARKHRFAIGVNPAALRPPLRSPHPATRADPRSTTGWDAEVDSLFARRRDTESLASEGSKTSAAGAAAAATVVPDLAEQVPGGVHGLKQVEGRRMVQEEFGGMRWI